MKKCSLSKRVWILLLAGFALITVQSMAFAADPVTAAPPKPQTAAPAQPQAAVPPTEDPKLLNNDCVKCHKKPSTDIAAAGAKHKTAIGCQDCHNGHPPAIRKIIPLCSQCHEDKPHYKLAACNSCHSNPHTPLNIKFGKNVTYPVQQCAALRWLRHRDKLLEHQPIAAGRQQQSSQCSARKKGPVDPKITCTVRKANSPFIPGTKRRFAVPPCLAAWRVDPKGFEPLTSTMPLWRSPKLSYGPWDLRGVPPTHCA